MNEQMPKLPTTEELERRILEVKCKIQTALLQELFGAQSDSEKDMMEGIVRWVMEHGGKIDIFFHENETLVTEYSINPEGVLEKVRVLIEQK